MGLVSKAGSVDKWSSFRKVGLVMSLMISTRWVQHQYESHRRPRAIGQIT